MSSAEGSELYNPLEQHKEGSENGSGGGGRQPSGGGGDSAASERTDICRDYLKNVCNRGTRCKFYHPPTEKTAPTTQDDIKFCIDFQNARGCQRDNCRFVHVRKAAAEDYRRTQEVTLELARAIAAVTEQDNINGIPFCKEFLNGKCSRGGNRCRYWHIDKKEERRRRMVEKHGHITPFDAYPDDHYGREPIGPPPPQRGGGDDLSDYFNNGPAAFGPPRAFGVGGGGGGGGYRSPPSAYPPNDYPMKRARYEEPSPMLGGVATVAVENSRLMAEFRNAQMKINEQATELESLRRELTRERERYEDLYALFRQQTVSHHHHQSAAVQQQGASGGFASAQSVGQLQPVVMSASATGPASSVGGGLMGGAAAGPARAAAADHMVSLGASMAGTPILHQSMAAMSSGPSDVAVHWSTMHR